jgi:phospholipid/cholesterol/gamma-HCH transport system ATP-binding protein
MQSTENRIIEVHGLISVMSKTVILSDINFHIEEGEIAMIIGGSGSGKTTVLKHLLGLYSSLDTAVTVLGENPSLLDEKAQKDFYKKIGVMYQEGALIKSMTVGENVGLPLEQHTNLPPDFIEEVVRLKLQMVHLEKAFDKFPSQLSGGMLKRVALARAIVMDPPILFCDEPGSGLDPITLSSLDELIINLKEQLGMTVVMVTHDVSSVLRMASRIIFLDQGVSIFQGSLEDALASGDAIITDFFARGKGE